jgi:hypothetical protein
VERATQEALTCLRPVRARLLAWADDADLRLYRCPPGDEDAHRNRRNNYRHLAEVLLQAELALARGA